MRISDYRCKPVTISPTSIAMGALFSGSIEGQESIYLKTQAGVVNLKVPSMVWTSPNTHVYNYAVITDHELIIRK